MFARANWWTTNNDNDDSYNRWQWWLNLCLEKCPNYTTTNSDDNDDYNMKWQSWLLATYGSESVLGDVISLQVHTGEGGVGLLKSFENIFKNIFEGGVGLFK